MPVSVLLELAFSVSEIERKTTGLFFRIVDHLIKLYKYRNGYDKNKHLNDIENWLNICVKLMFKAKSKITVKKLKGWYKYNDLSEYIVFEYHRLDSKYASLPIVRNLNDVINKILPLIDQILIIFEKANQNLKDVQSLINALLSKVAEETV